MRSRALAIILLTLSVSAAACKLIWGYDDFKDQPGAGGGDAGSDAPEKTANGLSCEAGTDCRSGNCEPGLDGGTVCCAAACGTCQTCSGNAAACAPVAKSAHGPGCTGSMVCDGAGGCKVPNGGACTDAGSAGCLSGTCMGATCCAMACPACQGCTGDGSGCSNSPACSTDTRCTTVSMTCDGNGNCI
jgi:hypothetical protein